MNLGVLAAAPMLLAALAGGGAGHADPAVALADSDLIIVTATTGPKLLVEPGRAGVDVAAIDVSAAKGATLGDVSVKAGSEKVDCGQVPATLSGDAKAHCEYALPALKAGEKKKITLTVTAMKDGAEVSRSIDFDVAAASLDARLLVGGAERQDAVVGDAAQGLPVAPGATVDAVLKLTNQGSDDVSVAAAGWNCPKNTLPAGGSTSCTRSVTAGAAEGERTVLDAAVTVKDADGRTGSVKRHAAVVVVAETALAQTGLPVGGTLVAALGSIAAGAGLLIWSRRR